MTTTYVQPGSRPAWMSHSRDADGCGQQLPPIITRQFTLLTAKNPPVAKAAIVCLFDYFRPRRSHGNYAHNIPLSARFVPCSLMPHPPTQ